jgi:hypothetical protein
VALAGAVDLTTLPTSVSPGTPRQPALNEDKAARPSATASDAPHVAGSPVAGGTLLQNFDGTSSADNSAVNMVDVEPPDQGLCVGGGPGNTQIWEPVNLAVRRFDTMGHSTLGPLSVSSFFGEPPLLPGEPPALVKYFSDPRCQFDAATNTFYFVVLAFSSTPPRTLPFEIPNPLPTIEESHLDIGVLPSGSNTLTVFKIDTTDDGRMGEPNHTGCPCFGDQPLLGIDASNLYLSTSEFPVNQPSPIFNGANVYAISKSQLAARMTPRAFAFYSISDQGVLIEALQPAINDFSTPGPEYLVHSFVVETNNVSTDHRLGVFSITNQTAIASGVPPTLNGPTVVNTETYVQPSPAIQPNPSPPPSNLAIAGDDGRLQQLQFVNGHLWAALTTSVIIPNDTATRDGIGWFELTPSMSGSVVNATVTNQGVVAAQGLYLLYPAIKVNKANVAAIGFSIINPIPGSSCNLHMASLCHPSAAYVISSTVASGGNFGSVKVAQTGFDFDHGFTCSRAPQCRWGDYSYAALDATSDNIWLATEYIPPVASQSDSNAQWGTRLYNVAAT